MSRKNKKKIFTKKLDKDLRQCYNKDTKKEIREVSKMRRMMKDVVTMLLVAGVFTGMLGVCGYVETHYTREECVVTYIDGDYVEVEDRSGYVWSYEVEDNAPSIGTLVDVHMHTNWTDSNIYDDMVLDVTLH